MAGRGGAGNILQAANRKMSQDLEANRGGADGGTETSRMVQTLQDERKEDAVAMSGRGGAGNIYSPTKLAQSGKFNTDAAQVMVKGGKQAGTRMQGRGGAGNYLPADAAGSPESAAEPLAGDPSAEALSQQTAEDVEKGLARPGRAYLGPKEREKEVPSPTT